ncbi:uncharacterized protein BJ212DRAFT_1288138, partial [Suillus subaureus]
PELNISFQCPLPTSVPTGTIFYFKALAVTASLLHTIKCQHPHQQVAIFSDNLNMVSMFNSLMALPPYNWLLMTLVDALLDTGVDFRVFFVLDVDNVVADHLLHWKNSEAELVSPGLHICPFTPPWNALGVARK